ncbi:hypothetical protein HMPREF0682_2989 [Propionibacterium acidifaciens F0233]|uniref:Uncharacterized protein n=1 Tax=Propionibacterium acidifaciens F0233 TaxID=553198 RepID=U2QVT1_9ACTN|nr:hypothetical protein HMPREF0682_2989 [Propionibacterium acidifaciens F0233]
MIQPRTLRRRAVSATPLVPRCRDAPVRPPDGGPEPGSTPRHLIVESDGLNIESSLLTQEFP